MLAFVRGAGKEEPAFVPGKITFQIQFPPHMRSISKDSYSTMATVLGYMSSLCANSREGTEGMRTQSLKSRLSSATSSCLLHEVRGDFPSLVSL